MRLERDSGLHSAQAIVIDVRDAEMSFLIVAEHGWAVIVGIVMIIRCGSSRMGRGVAALSGGEGSGG